MADSPGNEALGWVGTPSSPPSRLPPEANPSGVAAADKAIDTDNILRYNDNGDNTTISSNSDIGTHDDIGETSLPPEVQQAMESLFGEERRARSLEEKTRHAGVVWRNLSVLGIGAASAIQPTVVDAFLAIPRILLLGLTTAARAMVGKRKKGIAVRTIIDDFTVGIF